MEKCKVLIITKMIKSKLSSKYQIVLPKAIRKRLGLQAGMMVTLQPLDDDRALITKHSKNTVQALKGLGKEIWRSLGGGARYIKNERASWRQ